MEKVITIVKDGPYIVRGGVPLSEKVIAHEDGLYIWRDGRELPQSEVYSLCRCGRSGDAPFCDARHINAMYKDSRGGFKLFGKKG